MSGEGSAIRIWIAGRASRSSSPPEIAADSAGRRRTRSTIQPHIRPSPPLRRRRRNADLVDAVAEPREQRRQNGERAQHRDRDDHHRRDAERGERLVAGDEHAGHRDHHGQAGDQHRPSRGGGSRLERGPLAPALRAFLTLAPEVEHRVVDADREPDQEHERRHLVRPSGARGSPLRPARRWRTRP